MGSFFHSHSSLETLVWLFPISFLIHDFEEILFVEAWFRKNGDAVFHRVPMLFGSLFKQLSKTTTAQFAVPVLLQFVAYSFASFLAIEHKWYGLFLGCNVVLILHVFTHIAQSIVFRRYALGTGSAIFVTLPYSTFVLYRLIEDRTVSIMEIVHAAPYGIITIALVLIGHKLAPKIIR